MSWSRPEGKRGVRLKVLRFQIKYDLDMISRDFPRVFLWSRDTIWELKQKVDIDKGNSAGFLVLPLPQAANSKGGGDQRAR